MAISSSSRPWKARETSPERNKVWIEPKSKPRRVPVVYYISRNGNLEHPHFMEVSLSSGDGLYLRDVVSRLDFLRGKGMASLYSWSSKRSYKNGFVWNDLSEDDFIYPAHGNEYVLKGSEILVDLAQESPFSPSSASEKSMEASRSDDLELEIGLRRKKKTPWSSLDLGEYKVCKSELAAEAAEAKAADASTQTEEELRNRRRNSTENPNPNPEREEIEISPPPSSSSSETLETLIKADGGITAVGSADDQVLTAGSGYASGRFKASAVLMQLISCGSFSVRDVGPPRFPTGRPPRGSGDSAKEMDGLISDFGGGVRLEDKEYFSGSLIEMKKRQETGAGSEFSSLRRSNSYNDDRSSKLELAEVEIEGVRTKCIPRKLKSTSRKETSISRSTHGSKRINVEPPVPAVK